jgi:uncharacterized protein YjiS (DUF1127 family)
MLDALYAGRMASAHREIERRRDLIAQFRRALVERRAHLVVVSEPRDIPSVSSVEAVGERLCAALVVGRKIIAQWRRRVRMRIELATLTDGDLSDIRWTRAEIEAERRKPFWRA